jgi:hypothetical protein
MMWISIVVLGFAAWVACAFWVNRKSKTLCAPSFSEELEEMRASCGLSEVEEVLRLLQEPQTVFPVGTNRKDCRMLSLMPIQKMVLEMVRDARCLILAVEHDVEDEDFRQVLCAFQSRWGHAMAQEANPWPVQTLCLVSAGT